MSDAVLNIQKPVNFKEDVMSLEEKIKSMPGAIIGHEADESVAPLKHTFADGCYVREIFMPAGLLLTSKIHKVKHPYFVMKGRCSVLTEDGMIEIKAPFSGITEAGTKRVIHTHEDTVWITVHVTDETDLEKIEEQLIAKTFNDLQLSHEEVLKLKED